MWTTTVFLLLWFFASSNGQDWNPCGPDNGGCKFRCILNYDRTAGEPPFTCVCPSGKMTHPDDPKDCINIEFPTPEPVEAVVLSESTVELRWTSPQRLPSLPLLGFRVRVRVGPEERLAALHSASPNQLRFLMSNLLPGTHYHVVVEAAYAQGPGRAAPVTFQTPDLRSTTVAPTPRKTGVTSSAVFSTPKNGQKVEFPTPEPVEAVMLSEKEFLLRWTSPQRLPSLPLLQFRVYIREGPEERLNVINVSPHQLRFLMSDLLPGTKYHVVVEAVYAKGRGLAAPVTFQTPDLRSTTVAPTPRKTGFTSSVVFSTPKSGQKGLAPSRVRKIRVTTPDDTSLQVSWLPPRNHDQVEIVGYRVQLAELRAAKRGGPRVGVETELETGGTESLLRGLQPGTRYRLTVTARTSTALGAPRSKVAATSGLAPALRVHVGAVRVAGDSVLVKWGVGGVPDPPKVTFSVFYRTLINSSWSPWTKLALDKPGSAILQFQHGADHEFLVQARVPGRPAPLSSVVSLPEARPEVLPPEDVSVQVREGGRLLVRWEPRTHPDVIGYVTEVVEVDSSDVPRGQTRSQAVLGNQTLQELAVEQGHKYRLQMASLTLAGSSSTSRPVYFRVPAESQPFVRGELRGSEHNTSTSTRHRTENDEEETERAPPEVVPPFPSQRDVTEGAAFTFTCRVRSVLEPSIQWIRRVNKLAEEGERMDESTFEIEGQLFAMLPATDTELGEDGLYVSSYVITEATPGDAGMYVCVATNSRGYTARDTHLSVLPEEQYSPAIVPPYPRDVMVKAGDPVFFTCRIESQTKPTIKWLRHVGAGTGDSVEVEGRHFAELPSQRLGREQGVYAQRLELDEVYEEDAGLYLCMAINSAGSAFRTASLVVMPGKTRPYLPVFLAPYPQNLTAIEGDTVSFTCRVKSDGKPVMQWLKSVGDEERLNASSTLQLGGQTFQPLRVVMTQSWDGAYVSRLTLPDVVARDAATYVCLVSNVKGYRFRSGSLTVQKPDTLGFSPPKFLEPLPENTTVLVGTPVRLFCRVSSVLEPSIKWIRTVPPAFASQFDTYEEGGLLYTGVAATPSRPGAGGVLVSRVDIPSAQPSHAGTYVCLATNAAGLVRLPVSLDVLQSAAKVPVPGSSPSPSGGEAPKFFHPLERDVSITEGSSLLLQCSFNSSVALPQPRVQWVMEAGDTAEEGGDGRKSLGDGELLPVTPGSYVSRFLMTSPVDAGKYVCVVENAAGTATASINVTLTPAAVAAPGAGDVELAVRVLARQADRLLLGWDSPVLSTLDYFSLELSSPALPLPRTATPQGSEPRLWLYQLQPDTEYTLNLTAHACSGHILAWGSLQTRTLQADRPLLLVTTEAVDGGLLRVTWRGWGLPLVNSFRVTLQRPALTYTRSVTARPEQDSVWLGVTSGTDYVVTVAALSTSDVVVAEASVNVTTPVNFSTGNDVTTASDESTGSDVTTAGYRSTESDVTTAGYHSTRSPREPFVSTPASHSDRPLLLVTTEAVDGGLLRVTWRGWGLPLVNSFSVTLLRPDLTYTRAVTGRTGQDSMWLSVTPGTDYVVTVAALSTSGVVAEASVNVTTPVNFSTGNDVTNASDESTGSDVTTAGYRSTGSDVTTAGYHSTRSPGDPFVSTPYSRSGTTGDGQGISTPYNMDGEKTYVLPDTLDQRGNYIVNSSREQSGVEPVLRGKDGQIYDMQKWTEDNALRTPPGQPYTLSVSKNDSVFWNFLHFRLPLFPVDELASSYRLPRLNSNPVVSTVYVVLAAYDDTQLSFTMTGQGGEVTWNATLKRLEQAAVNTSLAPGAVVSNRPVAVFLQTRPKFAAEIRGVSDLVQIQMSPWSNFVFPGHEGILPDGSSESPLPHDFFTEIEGQDGDGDGDEDESTPRFLIKSQKVFVKTGDTAILPCAIAGLGRYTVAWTDRGDNLLAFRERRMTDDARLDVQHPEDSVWNLVLADVTPDDQGSYFCTVNTDPLMQLELQLVVTEAGNGVASTVIVREGETAFLSCSVKLHGNQKVIWTSPEWKVLTIEDRRTINDKRFSVDRPNSLEWNLRIADVSSNDEGLYLCNVNSDPPIRMGVQLVVERI